MKIFIASDIHGAYAELAACLNHADKVFLLGDFINILDYNDLSGILAQIVDRETIEETLKLIQEKKIKEAKALMSRTASGVENMFEKVGRLCDQCYKDLFSKLPCACTLINGNVDFPALITKNVAEPHVFVDQSLALDLDGRKIGLVAGHPHMTYSFGMPGEVSKEEYKRRLDDLGPVDHLLVHSPPAIRELSYDTQADRDEGGSEELLEYIDRHRPRTVHFGHVHSPIKREMTRGRTQMFNVGCFRDIKRLTVLEW